MKHVVGPQIGDFVVFGAEIHTGGVDKCVELKRKIDLIGAATLKFTKLVRIGVRLGLSGVRLGLGWVGFDRQWLGAHVKGK